MHPGNWLDHQTKERPFLSALIVLLLVMVPGYFRLENSVDTSNAASIRATQTSEDLIKYIEVEQVKQEKQNLFICQVRNTSSKNGRDRFISFFSFLEVTLTNNPNQTEEQKQRSREFISNLRASMPLDPNLEDVDCNGDGMLTADDYAT